MKLKTIIAALLLAAGLILLNSCSKDDNITQKTITYELTTCEVLDATGNHHKRELYIKVQLRNLCDVYSQMDRDLARVKEEFDLIIDAEIGTCAIPREGGLSSYNIVITYSGKESGFFQWSETL